MIRGFSIPAPPYPYAYSGMHGLGQIVPPVRQETTQKVVYLALGAVGFSLGLYLILKGRKRASR